MKIYVFVTLLLFLFTACVFGQTDSVNRNFKSRYEYVMSIIERVPDTEEDISLGLTLTVENDNSYKIYIGIKELYLLQYKHRFLTKEQLYFSVGKIFLRDTLEIPKKDFRLFKNYIVDSTELYRINRQNFSDLVSTCCADSYFSYNNVKQMYTYAYYFDRRFYPIQTVHNSSEIVRFDYSFNETNCITIFRDGEFFNQLYDRNGNFLREFKANEIE